MKKSKVSIKPLTIKSLSTVRPATTTHSKGNNGGYTWVG
jgi:hypothetical protein